MVGKIFRNTVLLLSVVIFLSANSVWAQTPNSKLRRVSEIKLPRVKVQNIKPLEKRNLTRTSNFNLKSSTPRMKPLSSKILSPKSLLKQNLKVNSPNLKNSQITNPRSLLREPKINLKPINKLGVENSKVTQKLR